MRIIYLDRIHGLSNLKPLGEDICDIIWQTDIHGKDVTPSTSIWTPHPKVHPGNYKPTIDEVAKDYKLQYPDLSVPLYIMVGGNPIAVPKTNYATLLYRPTQTLESLGKYHNEGLSLIDKITEEGLEIPETTSVVEVMAFLPVADDGEYSIGYVPQFEFDVGSPINYNVTVIKSNVKGHNMQKNTGISMDVKNIDEGGKLRSWNGIFELDSGNVADNPLPYSSEHMILILNPYQSNSHPLNHLSKPIIFHLVPVGLTSDQVNDLVKGGFTGLVNTQFSNYAQIQGR